ncbi:MAG: cytochrome P450 [Pseudomonadota bacterium]
MAAPPVYEIDPVAFHADPYPDLARMRATAPIAFVPQLGSILMTRRDHIAECEKNVAVFSSDQPGGLMNVLMGQNMMRKDGDAHQAERRATFPAYSPRTVRDHWSALFAEHADKTLNALAPAGAGDIVTQAAMPISGDGLRAITGLWNMTAAEIDQTSQAMIDGIANYSGDEKIEATCRAATAKIDAAIDARLPELTETPDTSLISVQHQAGLPLDSVKANVKLAISGGQNEPRDAIAGAVYALLTHPQYLAALQREEITWHQIFDEYVRWISPIGMSPRRIAQPHSFDGIDFEHEARVFFMFSSANRDEAHFEDAEVFDPTRNTSKHIAFGAGPHFCAGAAASRSLIADTALPRILAALPEMQLTDQPRFAGWAFRGLTDLQVTWAA